MMAVYDLLAPHYDAVTGDSAPEAAFIRDIIERRHGQAVTLLDLACGTGGITALLAGAYQVSGLDISPAMLAVAREKLPGGTQLYLADMTSPLTWYAPASSAVMPPVPQARSSRVTAWP